VSAAAAILLGYLVGALPTGLLVIRALRGVDIRRVGSGNIGAANVYRVAGLPTAALVLAADMAKGAAPVLLAQGWGRLPAAGVLAGLAAIAGHNWSVFLRFRGGKGIATSLGVLAALSPAAAAVAVGIWVAAVGVSRYASLGSLLAVASVPLVMWRRGEPAAHLGFGAVALLLALYTHRANIGRLVRGAEMKITDRPG